MAVTRNAYTVRGTGGSTTGTSAVAQLLDAPGDKIGCVFIAPDGDPGGDNDITKIGVQCTAVTDGGGLANLYHVVIYGYNATGGIPNTTDVGGGSPTLTTFTPSVGYQEITLTNAFTPTEGTAYAAVLEAAGTPSGTNNATFIRSAAQTESPSSPYCVSDTGGTWAKVSSVRPAISPIYANGLIVPGCEIMTAVALTNVNTGSSPDQLGIYWTADNSADCIGCILQGRWSTAAADWEIVMYSAVDASDVTVLNTITVDGEMTSGTGSTLHRYLSWEPVAVTEGSSYRIAMKPTSANNARLYELTFANSAHREGSRGPVQKTSKTDAGDWAESAAECPVIIPILSDSIAAGGGGGGSPGNMQGGLQ